MGQLSNQNEVKIKWTAYPQLFEKMFLQKDLMQVVHLFTRFRKLFKENTTTNFHISNSLQYQ